MFSRKSKSLSSLLVLLAATIALTGCGGGVGIGTMLKVAGVYTVLPSGWTSSGGLVRIVADVISGDALERVVAKVFRSGVSKATEVVLTPNAEGKFEGAFEADENTSEVTPEVYSATVTAVDTAGNVATSQPVEVEVPPATESPATQP